VIRWLAIVACALTVCITASSAFIRHAQGGLGCPPGAACEWRAQGAKGAASAQEPSDASAGGAVAAPAGQSSGDAAAAAPGVRSARALHRVSAMLVGVLVLLIAVFGWVSMSTGGRVALAFALADTVFLAWLGRFTPHPVPLVTIGNLVGGIALAAAFAWIAASLCSVRTRSQRAAARPRRRERGAAAAAFVALVLLAGAAWVGTMIGAQDAIAACGAARCAGEVRLDPAALDPLRTPQGVDAAAARGLHWLHRAAAVAFAFAALLVALRGRGAAPASAAALVVLLVAQAALGVGTTTGTNALATATLHNAVATLLAVTLATIAARSSMAVAAGR